MSSLDAIFGGKEEFDIHAVIDQFEADQEALYKLIKVGVPPIKVTLPRLDPKIFPPTPPLKVALAELKEEVRGLVQGSHRGLGHTRPTLEPRLSQVMATPKKMLASPQLKPFVTKLQAGYKQASTLCAKATATLEKLPGPVRKFGTFFIAVASAVVGFFRALPARLISLVHICLQSLARLSPTWAGRRGRIGSLPLYCRPFLLPLLTRTRGPAPAPAQRGYWLRGGRADPCAAGM